MQKTKFFLTFFRLSQDKKEPKYCLNIHETTGAMKKFMTNVCLDFVDFSDQNLWRNLHIGSLHNMRIQVRGRTHVCIKGQNLNLYLETHATPHNINATPHAAKNFAQNLSTLH